MIEDKKAIFSVEIIKMADGEEKFETNLVIRGYGELTAMVFFDVAQSRINKHRQDYLEQITQNMSLNENKGGIQ